MSDAISLLSVTKRFTDGEGTLLAVDGVTLALAKGSATLLVGPSGSGKTTLLTLIAGLSSPTSGEVHIEGQPVSRYREHHRTAFRRDHLGLVLQDLLLVPDLDALDNVLLPSVPIGTTPAHRARAASLLKRFDLTPRAHTAAAKLSGGERQRVALARALLLEPKILLFDEPTAHLDDENAAILVALLAGERAAGRTIVVATHDPRVIERADATVLRMRAGRVV